MSYEESIPFAEEQAQVTMKLLLFIIPLMIVGLHYFAKSAVPEVYTEAMFGCSLVLLIIPIFLYKSKAKSKNEKQNLKLRNKK